MSALEQKLDGKFTPANGGYIRILNEFTEEFIPVSNVARYDATSGDVYIYVPDYSTIEAQKSPAKTAEKPGEYSYYAEEEKPPIGCDFSAKLSYYGNHYYLKPLNDNIPPLKGRGMTYDEKYNVYKVTRKAYEKIKQKYAIKYEMCYD